MGVTPCPSPVPRVSPAAGREPNTLPEELSSLGVVVVVVFAVIVVVVTKRISPAAGREPKTLPEELSSLLAFVVYVFVVVVAVVVVFVFIMGVSPAAGRD